MERKDLAAAYRNPETRSQLGLEHPAGEVDEAQLKSIAGAQDVQPQTTWACATVTLITAVACPTTACTSSCRG
ncbi:class II lanthipeptide, LchA2/BrtA2 family [Salipaludibacillus daqingensis]|uniref:class II lanthipeptide, LchA2/BrtA2 family n=1 Tax=Salipaludibacillus daqingensis TaxID=3041001 RepID=UPI002473F579|nr:class II lanthipeptide, LchA2/BrtA2 family [Salipaludibacillus daqingensis]